MIKQIWLDKCTLEFVSGTKDNQHVHHTMPPATALVTWLKKLPADSRKETGLGSPKGTFAKLQRH